jgi:hypothetical protein
VRSEATCFGPATSLVLEVEVVSCSSAEDALREKVKQYEDLISETRARKAKNRGETPKPLDPAETELEVQKRMASGDVIAEFIVRRTRRFKESPKLKAEGPWQVNSDLKPVKYLVRIGSSGCATLVDEKKVVLFAPYQCCDTYPGSNDCMLHLPLAVDVPEDLLEHLRSGV